MIRTALLLTLLASFVTACKNHEQAEAPAPVAAAAPAPAVAREVDPAEAKQIIQKQPNVVVLDVRTPEEFATNHIAGAINMNVEAADFDQKIATLDKSKTHVVYCRTGRRSTIASQKLVAAGVPVNHLTGGITAWQKANLPTTRPSN